MGRWSSYLGGNDLIGTCSPALGGTRCAIGHVWEDVQCEYCDSLKSVCAEVKRMLLGDHMNRKFELFPGATPKYTMSSDLGAILLVLMSSAM